MASAMVCGFWNQIKGFSSRKNGGKSQNVKSKKGLKVSCVSSAAVSDPYKVLRIDRGASESEVKKAFRKLALRYHPDVCRGSDCDVQFHQINEACDIILEQLRGELLIEEAQTVYDESDDDDSMRGMDGEDWDLWEEWMGWEGAGIRDYSSHINPYI